MPTRRRCVCAVAHKKFIYVIGGHDGSSILNTVERYDTTRYSNIYPIICVVWRGVKSESGDDGRQRQHLF